MQVQPRMYIMFTSPHAPPLLQLFETRSPILRAVLGRPAPLAVLVRGVAGGLRVCAGGLDVTASGLDLTTGRLDTTRRLDTASGLDIGAGRVGLAVVVAAGGEGRAGVRLGVWLVSGRVSDDDSGGLAAAQSDCGGLGHAVGARARVGSRLGGHGGVNCLGDGDLGRRRAVSGLGDVDCGGRGAGAFRGMGLRVSDGADGSRDTGDRVGNGRDVGGQHVGSGERSAVVGGSALGVHRRAVRHEGCLGQGHREGAGGVDHRSLRAGDSGGRRLRMVAAALARCDSHHAGGHSGLRLSAFSVCDGAGRHCGVGSRRLSSGLVLGRLGVASRVRLDAGRVRGHSTSGVRWVRRLATSWVSVRRLVARRV